MSNIVVYPGTFDPITNGHLNIITRAAKVFDDVIVAVAADTKKKTLFDLDDRLKLTETSLSQLPNVKVLPFQGLLVEFVKNQKAKLIIRGVRAIADFEYEWQMAGMNHALMPEVDTLFFTPDVQYAHISSTLVKEIGLLGGDIGAFVSVPVVKAIKAKVGGDVASFISSDVIDAIKRDKP